MVLSPAVIYGRGMQSTHDRIAYLDGLRGWAAFVVLLYHAGFVFFRLVDPIYSFNAARVATDGTLAIYVFFVVSGFALSIRFLDTGDVRVVQALALRRYLRLGIPIFFASLAAYLLLSGGLLYHKAAATILGIPPHHLGLDLTPSILGLLKFSLFDIFFQYRIPESYGPVLWTMPVEFIGSFVVFAMLLLYPKSVRGRVVVFCGFLFAQLYVNPTYSCFLYGVLFAHASRLGSVQRFRATHLGTVAGVGMVVAVALFSAFGQAYYNGYWLPLAGTLLVAAPVVSAHVASFFDLRMSQFLGRVSFSLYLTHFLVLCSLMSWVIVVLSSHGLSNLTIARIVPPVSIVVCLLVATGFHRIEVIAIDLSRQFSDWCFARAGRADDTAAVTGLPSVQK